jgi:hypothetical protein
MFRLARRRVGRHDQDLSCGLFWRPIRSSWRRAGSQASPRCSSFSSSKSARRKPSPPFPVSADTVLLRPLMGYNNWVRNRGAIALRRWLSFRAPVTRLRIFEECAATLNQDGGFKIDLHNFRFSGRGFQLGFLKDQNKQKALKRTYRLVRSSQGGSASIVQTLEQTPRFELKNWRPPVRDASGSTRFSPGFRFAPATTLSLKKPGSKKAADREFAQARGFSVKLLINQCNITRRGQPPPTISRHKPALAS